MKSYILNVLIAFDQLWNVILGGALDTTISARAAKAWQAHKTWGCVLCRLLDWFQKDHCIDAIATGIAEAQYAELILQRKEEVKIHLLAARGR